MALSFEELDALPSSVIRELRGPEVRAYACHVRGERNKYRALYQQAIANLQRVRAELFEARGGCKRLADRLRTSGGAGSA